MKSIVKAIFDGIYKIITDLLNVIIYPITAFTNTLFPDLSNYISQITTFMNQRVTPLIAYFGNMIPPITKSVILLWLGFLATYYLAVWTYIIGVKIFNVIRKIKFW